MDHGYFVRSGDCSRHTIFPGVDIQTMAGGELMLSLVEMQAGAVVEEHSHPHEQAGMVLAGRAEFIIDGDSRVLGPGDLYRIPGGVPHKVIALDQPVRALDVFHPVRDEYR